MIIRDIAKEVLKTLLGVGLVKGQVRNGMPALNTGCRTATGKGYLIFPVSGLDFEVLEQ